MDDIRRPRSEPGFSAVVGRGNVDCLGGERLGASIAGRLEQIHQFHVHPLAACVPEVNQDPVAEPQVVLMRLNEGILVAVELWGFNLVALVVEEVLDRLDGFLVLLVADEVDSSFAILLRLAK